MSDTTETLVRMVNQIGANLMHEPNPAAATAEHIRLFWDPRMRSLIMARGTGGLTATAVAAISQLQTPQSAQ